MSNCIYRCYNRAYMWNMSKSKPLSVKFSPETRSQMKAICAALGKSENALVNEAMESIIHMIQAGQQVKIPKLVVLAQAAQDYDQAPPQLHERHAVSYDNLSVKEAARLNEDAP